MRLDYTSPEALSDIIEALLFASDEPLSATILRGLILGEAPRADEAEPELGESDGPLSESDGPLGESAEELTEDAEGPAEDAGPATIAEMESVAKARETEKKRKRKQLIELVTIHVAVQHLNGLYEQHGRAFRIVEIAGGYQFATRAEYGEFVSRLSKEKARRRLSGASLEALAIVAYKQPVSKLEVENIRGVNCDEVLKSLLEKNLITITGRAEAVGRPLLYGTTQDFLRHFGLNELKDLPRPREIEELLKEESVRATTLEEAATEFTPDGEATEGMTIDAALAVAKELGERELEVEELRGIELDEVAFANPGHDSSNAELK